ncbi:uncharacterized protein LOC131667534 [Phymastichus coffea]|uniref:uncharacterized protein LOC131667534 n=1 Tax=Phymastichus coffea TaxID=108790 RepID=UPI00273C9735|nr:uncharacterized protein LOC131667534 [Phymastichus coffea]
MDTEQRIMQLEQSFNELERSINTLDAILKQGSPDVTVLEMRASDLAYIFAEYSKNHEELKRLDPDHPNTAKFIDLDIKYYTVAAEVNKLNKNAAPNPLANSTALNSSFSFAEKTTVAKIAAIQVPNFDGSSKNWVSWKSRFKALIHERPGMAPSVKLSQLQSSVSGLAQKVISRYEATDENYPLAWTDLCNAYDQRRVIANDHLDALLNLSPHAKSTAETTAELMYTVRQHVSMLEAMEINIGEQLVARILERCLPAGILSRWVDRQSSNKLSEFSKLCEFVQDSVFKQREMDELPSRKNAAKRAANSNAAYPSKVTKTAARSLLTSSSSSIDSCLQCGQPHRLYACDAFKAAELKAKWKLVNTHKLCRNCLYVHPVPCTSKNRCKEKGCNKAHHTLLHPHKNSKDSTEVNSQSSKETDSPKSL